MKSIFATAVALSLFAIPALAETRRVCGKIHGYDMCALDTANIDTLQINWTDGDHTAINAHCESGDWIRTGYEIPESDITAIVNHWCSDH